MIKLKDFLREERDRRGLTQRELSEKANISLPMISYIENGKKAGRRTLVKLATMLEVDYLFLRQINNTEEKE
ncbi:MAG: helix-turn-helix transcriptional regulator [Methanolobus sp.]|nr:helix-turn-helix transcriptional regulator [Methanolobus sp.]